MKTHRKLTERERDRMVDVYASGPLTYRPEIDDPLFGLDLISFYDFYELTEKDRAVEAKHGEEYFYAKNGSVLKEWYGPDKPEPLYSDMKLPPGMACQHCASFSRCAQFCGAKGTWTSCDWSPSKFKEKTWEMWTLRAGDIIKAAQDFDVDFERVANIFKKKIEAAVENQWDEFLADAIDEAWAECSEASVKELQKSELRAMGGGDPNI